MPLLSSIAGGTDPNRHSPESTSASDERRSELDFNTLCVASRGLLGYSVHTGCANYLSIIIENLRRWRKHGIIDDRDEPNNASRYSLIFDFNALDFHKIIRVNGTYFYIFSCHKGANYSLMHRYEGKQVLYLRGFDYEASVTFGGGVAFGFSSASTMQFTHRLGHKLGRDVHLFKTLSPEDIHWDSIATTQHFYGDFNGLIPLATYPFRSVYLNARRWQQDVSHLFDRMDHFIVYVSSLTESVLWELQQLDTDDRRRRVTVVFDEKAISNKDSQIGMQRYFYDRYGDNLIWKTQARPSDGSAGELREKLAQKFALTTPEDFERDIERHRRRIADSTASLAPGERETYLDFHYYPAVDDDTLVRVREGCARLQRRIAAQLGTEGTIECLPLFLNDVQLEIFLTLLLGDHRETGRALAVYAAVMHEALEYYGEPGTKRLSVEGRESHLTMLREHYEMAQYIAKQMFCCGKSHEFSDLPAVAEADYAGVFDATRAAVRRFFLSAMARSVV